MTTGILGDGAAHQLLGLVVAFVGEVYVDLGKRIVLGVVGHGRVALLRLRRFCFRCLGLGLGLLVAEIHAFELGYRALFTGVVGQIRFTGLVVQEIALVQRAHIQLAHILGVIGIASPAPQGCATQDHQQSAHAGTEQHRINRQAFQQGFDEGRRWRWRRRWRQHLGRLGLRRDLHHRLRRDRGHRLRCCLDHRLRCCLDHRLRCALHHRLDGRPYRRGVRPGLLGRGAQLIGLLLGLRQHLLEGGDVVVPQLDRTLQILDDALQLRDPAAQLFGLSGLGVRLFLGQHQILLGPGGIGRLSGCAADTFGALATGHQRQPGPVVASGLRFGGRLLRRRLRFGPGRGSGGFRLDRRDAGARRGLRCSRREALTVFLPDVVLTIDLRKHDLAIGSAELRDVRNVEHGPST